MSLSDVILGRPLASQEVEKEELSYRQTQAAYPNGGGAYLVAKDNLGLWAGVALLLDYCSTWRWRFQPESAPWSRPFRRCIRTRSRFA